jgi:hypothetical protein
MALFGMARIFILPSTAMVLQIINYTNCEINFFIENLKQKWGRKVLVPPNMRGKWEIPVFPTEESFALGFP